MAALPAPGEGLEARPFAIMSDGASRGNPGPAGAGAIIRNERGQVVREICQYLGLTTNNQAEYAALILALEAAAELGALAIDVALDSELVVKQLTGTYRVRSLQLAGLHRRARELLAGFVAVSIRHVPRERNRPADELANKAIDTLAGT